jgi:hypothetical protein
MKRIPALLALLTLASCASQYRRGREDFHDAMYELSRDPASAREIFTEADEHFQAALASTSLTIRQRIAATSFRIRGLIELDRNADARDLASAPIEGFDPGLPYEGDPLGLILLRAHQYDPEHAFAELLLADRRAGTPRARLHVAWEMVHALERMGKPQSKAEAARICDQNAGKLDFDDMKKRLGN